MRIASLTYGCDKFFCYVILNPFDKKTAMRRFGYILCPCASEHNRRETIAPRIRTAVKSLVAHVGICFTRTASICIGIRTTITCDNRGVLLHGCRRRFFLERILYSAI